MTDRTAPADPREAREYDRDALAMDLEALRASMPVLLGSGSYSTTVSVHMLDRLYRAALAARQDEPSPALRPLDCPVCASGDVEHKRAEALDLPPRIVVDARGFYWRDYGDHYSMCPVSEDNEPVKPAAAYVPNAALAANPPQTREAERGSVVPLTEMFDPSTAKPRQKPDLWGNPNRAERMRAGAPHGDWFIVTGRCKTCNEPYPCAASEEPMEGQPREAEGADTAMCPVHTFVRLRDCEVHGSPQTREAEGAAWDERTTRAYNSAVANGRLALARQIALVADAKARDAARTPEAQRDAPRMADHPETQWNDLDPELAALRAGGQRDAGNRGPAIDPERLRATFETELRRHGLGADDIWLCEEFDCEDKALRLLDQVLRKLAATQPPAAGTEGGE